MPQEWTPPAFGQPGNRSRSGRESLGIWQSESKRRFGAFVTPPEVVVPGLMTPFTGDSARKKRGVGIGLKGAVRR
jgi:hypothetical protein